MRFILICNLVFQVVAKSNRHGKGHIVIVDQTTKGTLEAQRARCPSVEPSE